jgi:hypothetical protein
MHRLGIGLVLAVWLLAQASAVAGPITVYGDMANSEHGLGNFTATLTYNAIDASNATLEVSLTNTTPSAGGYITAFVLNNPGNAISGITQDQVDLELLGSAPFQNGVNGAPFGQFDFGVGTGGGFEGGGPPSDGIPVGDTGTVTFTLTGTNLHLLNEMSFVNTVSEGVGAGQGYQFMVVRFRGMEEEPGSDKVPANHAPEPGTLALSLLAVGALLPMWRRRREN